MRSFTITLRVACRPLAIARRIEEPFVGRTLLLGLVVGVLGGLGAVAFQWLLVGSTLLFFGASSQFELVETVVDLPWYYRVLAPAIGGAVVGLIASYGGDGGLVRGEGVPEVLEAMDTKGGALTTRVAPAKILASAVCIGSGGSVGREGPIVQIGGAFGSAIGRRLHLTPGQTNVLLAGGAAAGLGGTFNAPIGGAIFAWEVLLGRVTRRTVPPVAIASFAGTATANVVVGLPDPIFSIPPTEIVSYWEVLAYVGLGFVAVIVALFFAHTMYAIEDGFERVPLPANAKPALGGLCLGVLALFAPEVHATGYGVIHGTLLSGAALEVAIAFVVAKILATSLTLGSGGSGGIFAPALFVGAMTGTAYGELLEIVFPGLTAGSRTYATIGMAAVFAGLAHAPLTGIVVVYELTGDLRVVVPLTIACLVSGILARRVAKTSIYTTGLVDRGVDVRSRRLL